jgi:HD superfamily phosphohydrolase
MQIQDAIHGYIGLNDLEEAVLDTPEMQRLRRVRQLGFSNLVYPSATHTRFEHSLGAMHLADMFASSMQLGEGRAQELRLAALLHDLGHGPFSHVTDDIFHDHGMSHEAFSKRKIQNSRIADLLHDHGIHPNRVTKLIDGNGRLGSIVAGHIDVDRMDYLMRDAHYTGVAYGTIDAETIIRAARIEEQELVFDRKYLNALESLLTARYLMMPTVYLHQASRGAAMLFHEAFRLLEQETDIGADELAYMDDMEIVGRMRRSDTAAPLIERLLDRRLYKVATTLPDAERSADSIRDELCDATGLTREEILVDTLQMAKTRTYDVPVHNGETVEPLDDLSSLPEALQQALQQQNMTRIYADPTDVDAVADAAASLD